METTQDPALEHPWVRSLDGNVFHQCYPPRFSDEELDVFLRFMEDLPQRLPTPYAWVVELGGLLRAPARQKRRVQATSADNEEHARLHNVGTAIVAESAIARGLVRATYLVKAPVFPAQVVSSLEEGVTWVRKCLAAKGVTVDGS